MRFLDTTHVNLRDTFSVLLALPRKEVARGHLRSMAAWKKRSAMALSEAFCGSRELHEESTRVLERLLVFRWTLDESNMLGLWGEDFTRKQIVYSILGKDPLSCLLSEKHPRRVLVLGDTGSGKEAVATLVACGLVSESGGMQRSYRKLSAAEFGGDLLQSELFGHEKGSFTGAVEKHKGILGSLPEDGVLFLDEVGQASREFQAKLLRVLQTGQYRAVGSTASESKRFHMVAATSRDGASSSRIGGMQTDLFFRLAQTVIELPSLVDLTADPERASRVFKTLFEYELRHFWREAAGEDLTRDSDGAYCDAASSRRSGLLTATKQGRLSTEDMQEVPNVVASVMRGYSWPGNLRECSNLFRRIIRDWGGRATVEAHCKALHVEAISTPEHIDRAEIHESVILGDKLVQTEKAYYVAAAQQFATISEIAKHLGVARQTAARRLRHFNIAPGARGLA